MIALESQLLPSKAVATSGAIRISTVATALLIAAFVGWRRRSPLIALVAVMAWAASFEIVFLLLGTIVHGWPVANLVWVGAALAGWVVLAAVVRVFPDLRLALAAALVAVAWVVTGFAVNTPSSASFSPAAEAFNELSKTLLGAAYAVGALRVHGR